jgi:23S rRNA (guanosine2251-2'-O)-methyltransferase
MTRARGPAKPAKARQRVARGPQGGRPVAAKSPRARPASAPSGGRARGLWLYGRHAVTAALANPSRSCHRLLATAEALAALGAAARRPGLEVATVERAELERRLGADAVHQGLALSAAPLPRLELRRACAPEPGRNLVLLLDQVTDPHNLGAVLRSAAAFEVRAVVLPARGSAELSGAVAKAASGALDVVPLVEVVNLARALDELAELGYWRIALDGHAPATLDEVPDDRNLVLALGAEGSGLRRLVAERCDFAARLPIAPAIESLNVSVACGIALYALARRQSGHG